MRLIGLVVLALGVLGAPLAAEGQQTGKIYRLGWFAFSPPTNPEALALHDAFLQELRAQGFVEGRTFGSSAATPKVEKKPPRSEQDV
jgi:hypothetical protein